MNKSDSGSPRLSAMVLVYFNANRLDFFTCLCICVAQLQKACMAMV